jgi:PcfJ-like protein
MSDLIDGEIARQAAYKRMEEMFPTNRGLSSIYWLMANAHRYAINYIEQAPVILLAATRGNAHVSLSEWAFVKEQFSNMCESGAQLRDVMRAYGLPLPLRLLDARVLTATRATVIRRLALMNPSTLAQIIPTTRQKQNAWLQALDNWCAGMAHRSGRDHSRCLFFEWAATNYPGVTYTEANGAGHMMDFVCAHANTFNPRWTLNRARAEEQKWHADLAVAKVVERTGMSLDTVIDYTPLPLLWEHGGLSFVALQTGNSLRAEGAAMHHCVASYWQNVADGRSRIYSILENGNRVATLDLSNRLINYRWGASRYQVRQLVGTCNSRPVPEVVKAVGTFVDEINDCLSGSEASPTNDHELISTASAVVASG